MRTANFTRRARLSASPGCSVGPTTSRHAFRADRPCRVAVRYASNARFSGVVTSPEVTVDARTDYTGGITLSGLLPDTVYTYRYVVDGRESPDMPLCTFRTFPASGTPVNFSFVFGACNGRTSRTATATGHDTHMYTQTFGIGARFVLFLGDVVYVDDERTTAPPPGVTSLKGYRSFHLRATRDEGWIYTKGTARMRRSGPMFYMYDDHELINDFDDGKTGRWIPGVQAWFEYHGRSNPNPIRPGEQYFAFQYGDVGIFVVDGRAYRSQGNATDQPGKTYLGAMQLQDLKNWLLVNNAAYKIKVIATSTPVSGYDTTEGDSWGGTDDGLQTPNGSNGYRTERNNLWDFIDANNISGVIFLSADQHWGASFKVTYAGRPRYEFSCSPFNRSARDAPVAPADPVNGPIFWKYDDGRNHGLVSINTTVANPTLVYQLFNPNGSLGSARRTAITRADLDLGL
jgi:alkaline phosphatase D